MSIPATVKTLKQRALEALTEVEAAQQALLEEARQKRIRAKVHQLRDAIQHCLGEDVQMAPLGEEQGIHLSMDPEGAPYAAWEDGLTLWLDDGFLVGNIPCPIHERTGTWNVRTLQELGALYARWEREHGACQAPAAEVEW